MTAEEKKTNKGKGGKTADRATLKKKLAALKKVREETKSSKDSVKLERIRRQYRRVTHALRRLALPKPKKVKAE